MSKLLTEIERQSIEQRIAKIENDTSGEVVIAIKDRSGRYHRWALAAAAAGAAVAAFIGNGALSRGGTVEVEALPLLYAMLGGAAVLGLLFFVPPLQALLLPRTVCEHSVRAAAARHFQLHGVGRTKERTGVLLYMSAFERQAVVMADEGLARLVAEGFWEAQALVLRDGLGRGQLAVAIHKVLSSLGELLHAKAPPGKNTANELPNKIEMP